jgi:adenylylsulfate kinase
MTTFVLMAGLPGTGKSTLAKALTANAAGVVLSKDEVRAALFPGSLTDYSAEQDDLVFAAILNAADYLASRGLVRFVILDGRTFSRHEHIDWVLRVAKEAGCCWKILLTICPDSVATARLIEGASAHPAANRTIKMYREVKARFEPIVYPHLEIDTSFPLETCVQRSLAYLTTEPFDSGQCGSQ